MKLIEIETILLQEAYKQYEKTNNSLVSLNLNKLCPNTSQPQQLTAIQSLKDKGLLKSLSNNPDMLCEITSKGIHLMEDTAPKPIPTTVHYTNHDKSVNIGGNILNSNFAAHSSGVYQNVSVNPEIDTLFSEVASIIRADTNTGEQEKSESLQLLDEVKKGLANKAISWISAKTSLLGTKLLYPLATGQLDQLIQNVKNFLGA